MNNYPQHRFQPGGGAIERANVTAVLGPTNTGKTHLAVERMLGHASGMIGLPLRLLAREIYDRVVRLRGPACVALITGEEKIIPPRPAYYVCTVESMPLAIEVEFLAVDEIQLCADAERGHIFTDRLLHARGRLETMFMGSQIMAPLIRQLLPHASFITRPRFSNLSYAGSLKLSRIPRRSAIVAFSAEEVYGIAELIRRQRGGAAVVMGALSPRTRNAQVALYQSGEVDFLVATDAIGMGLNMDVDHVAFASLSKFDGVQRRNLRPIEIGQIAGRAGRYLNDGTFGVTGEAPAMDEALIARIENHRFDPLLRIKWRNNALDFGSAARLFASLEAPPPLPGLGRTREAADVVALRRLLADADIAHISRKPGQLKRLWNICQVPDFRKLSPELHAQLLGRLYRHLMSEAGVLPHDEVARQVERLDRTDGDIDTLSTRIAHVRTWTYIANRNDWLIDAAYWRGRTRAIEDRLSDALHERLTQRFIDCRTSVLMKRLHQKEKLLATLTPQGDVLIEGEFAGRLDGFRFAVDASADGVHLRTLRNAATQALQSEIEARAFRLERHARIDDGKIIVIGEDGLVRWEGMAVARLIAGHDMLSPQLEVLADAELLQGQAEISVREALAGWLARYIAKVMEPLISLHASGELQGLSKGLAFQLFESMGVLERARVGGLVKGIEQSERGRLRALGVRFGERHIFMPAMLKPGPMALKLNLWRAANGITRQLAVPGAGLSSAPADATQPDGFYAIAGFEVCGPRAIRIDMLERLLAQLRLKNSRQGFPLEPALWSPVGCNVTDFEGVMRALGYAPVAAAPAPAPEPLAAAEDGDATVDSPATSGAGAPEAAPETPPAPPVLWKLQQRHSARIRRATPADPVARPAARERKPDKPKKPRNTVSIPLADKPARAPRPAAKPSLNIPLAAKPRETDRPGFEPRRPKQASPRLAAKPPKPPRPPEKPFDPDSPFAKLLALKERMQKSS